MHIFGRHIYRTSSGVARVFDTAAPDGSTVRVLKLGGVYQSASYIDERRFSPAFAYYRAFDAMFRAEDGEGDAGAANAPRIGRVLMLGGGGYAWPKHALATRPGVCVDVVEIDPAITAIARRHFFLDEAVGRFDAQRTRLRCICDDGRAFLENSDEGRAYDAIVNDTFSGREPIRSLSTVQAARAAKRRLALGGLYLANVVSEHGGEDIDFLRDTVATLLEEFSHVHIIPCSDEEFGGEDNYLVIATDSPTAFPGAIPYDADFPGDILHD